MPEEFTLGDTIKFTKSLADFPYSDGWTLTYYFVKKDGTANIFNVVAEQSGTSEDYLVTIASDDTSSLAAGFYSWRARITKATETSTIEEGSVTLNPDYSEAVDTRSDAAQILAAIDAALAGAASITQKRYKIRDREIERYDPGQLQTLRTYYAAIVKAEQTAELLAQGLPNPNKIRTRLLGN